MAHSLIERYIVLGLTSLLEGLWVVLVWGTVSVWSSILRLESVLHGLAMLDVIASMILLSAPITPQRAVQRQAVPPPTLPMPRIRTTWNESHIQPPFHSQKGMNGHGENDVWRLAPSWF